MKSDKMLYIIYADLESLIRKIDGCKNNPQNSSATNTGENIRCGYSMPIIWGVWSYRKQAYFMSWKRLYKKFCASLSTKHAKNIIDFEKKKMLPLTKEELKS